jgi:prepilin-type N-terminal cleavage/methylation domain-containing protein
MRRGFTLMELLIVILIIGLLAGLSVAALAGAAEQARVSRTKSIIAKLDQLIGAKWESYRTRTLPIRTTGMNPQAAAGYRLNAIRELQRMELPGCRADVLDDPAVLTTLPALTRTYRRKALASWGGANEEAECLYLIVSAMHDGDKNALDFFGTGEIGDLDEDGMREILDGWGQPMMYLRWAPGFREDAAIPAVTFQRQTRRSPEDSLPVDSFDPVKIDPRLRDGDATNDTFDLRPLIYSMGSDRQNGIAIVGTFRYATSTPPNDPFWSAVPHIGSIVDPVTAGDNITNHWQDP